MAPAGGCIMQGLSGRADAASYVRISENPIQANFSELRACEVHGAVKVRIEPVR